MDMLLQVVNGIVAALAASFATPEMQVSWAGCLSGLLGSALLAGKGKYAGWGFVAYLGSNMAWVAFAICTGNVAMLVQQVGFTLTSLWGIHSWLLQARPAPA